MNEFSHFFRERERSWFNEMRSFLPLRPHKILKIGNGFGHLSEMIREFNTSSTILDVTIFDETVNGAQVMLYDGEKLDFTNGSFDTCVLNLTLHHIRNSRSYFRNEILRVTAKRVILIEETYDNIFQKIHLVFRDWWLNRKAGQPCRIHWGSYFSRKQMTQFIRNNKLTLVKRMTTKHHSYFKELIVIDL